MAATGRFDSFHASFVQERRGLPAPRETHVVWAGLTGLVAVATVALTMTVYHALDARVAALMADLGGVTEARDANGFFTLPAAN